MDIKIGFVDTPRELDIELGDDTSQDGFVESLNNSLASAQQLIWMVDKKGRKFGIMVSRVSYVVVGAANEERRVGFGA